jgi:hypothetical protein
MSTVLHIYRTAKLSGPAALVASVLLLAGCAGLKTDYELMRERAHAYVAAHPKLAPETAGAIRSNQVHEGMTMAQVVAAWGRPVVVQRFRNDTVQYWFFGCDWPHICTDADGRWFPSPDEIFQSRALFDNGRLVEWQD